MKSFSINLIPFIVGAACFWLLGWYQADFHAPEGDLVRTSFIINKRHYSDPKPLPNTRDSVYQNIFLVGDSHLDPNPSNRRFQNHLETQVSSHSHFAYHNHSNPFTLGIALAQEHRPNLVVFEVVERMLIHFAQGHLSQDSIPTPSIRIATTGARRKAFNHLGNGVRTMATLLNMRYKWLQNDQCRVLPSRSDTPLHSHDQILITKMVWERRKPSSEVNALVDSLKQVLSHQLKPFGTDFILYVIPDKATVYSDFFESSSLHPSFLLDSELPDKLQSPVKAMRNAVNAGVMEVYKYSDTHLGETGAQITGAHLNDILADWQEIQTNSIQLR